jgi:BirA family transcriptional regulator, biotin operon repressor / biotin---[acetyl-CoA-carboxylase] ligase
MTSALDPRDAHASGVAATAASPVAAAPRARPPGSGDRGENGAPRGAARPPVMGAAATSGATAATWMGAHRVDLDSCGSTNDEAARLARAGAGHGTVVTARQQRSGRGRAGRTWASPAGGNLYVSLILRPALPLRDVPAMTLAIGVAVCDVARGFGVAATLKWPNDVLIEGRKVAGILLESQSRGDRLDVVIAGIGINLSTTPAAEDAPHATSLAAHTATPLDREAFLQRLLPSVEHWIDRYVASGLTGILPAWHASMDGNTRARAVIAGQDVLGKIEGLDDSGALLLRDARGVLHHVIAGEVETLRAP